MIERTYICILWILTFCALVSGNCYDYSEKETLTVEYPDTGLHQIHVRHNLKVSF